jgi:hypothetical protein
MLFADGTIDRYKNLADARYESAGKFDFTNRDSIGLRQFDVQENQK